MSDSTTPEQENPVPRDGAADQHAGTDQQPETTDQGGTEAGATDRNRADGVPADQRPAADESEAAQVPAADEPGAEEVPPTEELEEPSTEKEPAEEPKAPRLHDPEPDHQAVGIGVEGRPQVGENEG